MSTSGLIVIRVPGSLAPRSRRATTGSLAAPGSRGPTTSAPAIVNTAISAPVRTSATGPVWRRRPTQVLVAPRLSARRNSR